MRASNTAPQSDDHLFPSSTRTRPLNALRARLTSPTLHKPRKTLPQNPIFPSRFQSSSSFSNFARLLFEDE